MKRPRTIIYGLDDKPPLAITVLTGLQHVALLSIFLLFPVLACREAGLSPEKTIDVLSLSMLVIAIGPILQAFSRGPMGSAICARRASPPPICRRRFSLSRRVDCR